MNGAFGETMSPLKRVIKYGAPAAVGAFATDQVYRLVPRFIPMDLSKRTPRILLGTAISLGIGMFAGMIFSDDEQKQIDMMALTFAGGIGSVILREQIEG